MKLGKFLIPVILVIGTALGCSKSGEKAKPTFTLESIEKNPIKDNDSLVVHFKFNNNGGRVASGTFVSIRNRQNQVPPSDVSAGDTLRNFIPDFEGASKGEFRYALPRSGYMSMSTSIHLNDTIIMRFFVLSNTGVSSDTINSPKIIVINP